MPTHTNTSPKTQTRNLGPIPREMERDRQLTKARETVAQAMADLYLADEYREDCRRTYIKIGDVYASEAYTEAIDRRRKAVNELIRARESLSRLKFELRRK